MGYWCDFVQKTPLNAMTLQMELLSWKGSGVEHYCVRRTIWCDALRGIVVNYSDRLRCRVGYGRIVARAYDARCGYVNASGAKVALLKLRVSTCEAPVSLPQPVGVVEHSTG